MEGPRGTRVEEVESLRKLIDVVYGHPLENYPQLFNEDNLENCRIILEDGKIVSHVGLTEQTASIFGCQVGVGCIGEVCTHPDYRKRGFATEALEDACAKAYVDGIDFLIISGDRSLYRRAGCRTVGQDYSLKVDKNIASQFESDGYSFKFCTKKDIPTLSQFYRAEPIRFMRTRKTYEWAFDCSIVMDNLADFIVVEKKDSSRAYLVIQRPQSEKEKTVQVYEYAGERRSILASLSLIIDHYELEALRIHIYGSDTIMRDLLLEKDVELQISHSKGTVLVINFVQFMSRTRPYFFNIIGETETNRLQFLEYDGTYRILYESDQVVIPDRGELAHILFGTVDSSASRRWVGRRGDTRLCGCSMVANRFEGEGKASKLLQEVLPIPALWYGINYI